MKRKLALVLLAVLVCLSSVSYAAPRATATPKPTPTPKPIDQSLFPVDGSTAEADTVLRATAYARGKIVDTLKKGLKLTVTGASYANDGSLWYAVTTKSSKKEGYLPAEAVLLDVKPTATPKPSATPKKSARATATPKPAERNNEPISSRGYIGNSNSKVFHLPTCSHLPNQENQVSFSSRAKAVSEGYRACEICKP
ncbi:MAG: hypothetical protein IJG56_00185 [Clostridia bacterium]|nr:hypothetical protein [Clostridia bacterium]